MLQWQLKSKKETWYGEDEARDRRSSRIRKVTNVPERGNNDKYRDVLKGPGKELKDEHKGKLNWLMDLHARGNTFHSKKSNEQ